MNVNDVVAARIAAARARIEANERRRLAQQAARNKGLAQRHVAKLRNLAGTGTSPQLGPRATAVRRRQAAQEKELLAEREEARALRAAQPEPDDVVVELTTEEFYAAARRHLAELGMTYEQLADQAARRDFASTQAHLVWHVLDGSINPDLL